MYNLCMIKATKDKILKYYNSLELFGYEYTSPLKLEVSDENHFDLPQNLTSLQSLVENCNLCEYSKYRVQTLFSQGNPSSKVMFIDDTPSILDEISGKILVGKSGELLIKMIENVLMINHKELYFTNIIKCKTALKKIPTHGEISSCKPYIQKEIEIINPKLIVVLGESTYEYFTNDKTSIELARGKVIQYGGIDLIPIYHPSYLLRNPSAKKEAFHDMLKIKSIMEKM
ncbi:MAG: uracil-DNA glycosylase [Candidatus Marinarcus sp.]|uniref:uracil-DNA glycosylase n=1 Tax=Candidatus Marinarcus sp. TaxID=3100987 RepID=UPI003B009239